jgi:hypothetical protein
MKLLVTVPHFYRPEQKAPYGSLEKNPEKRILAFTAMIRALYETFHAPHCMMNIANKTAIPANHAEHHHIDIVVCTTGEHHLLNQINLPKNWYTHCPTTAEPRMLGFECHKVLQQALPAKYDFYCFMEDDLVLHDPMLFHKLHWFTDKVGDTCLLQPHLYETSPRGPFFKVYLNGEINPRAAKHLQNIDEDPELLGTILDRPTLFRRTTNPHSGCFFLNRSQMQHWASQPYFLDHDCSFVDPMASAATLGITKTFKVYKPALENAYFLEMEHMDRRYLWQVGANVAIAKEKFTDIGYRFK